MYWLFWEVMDLMTDKMIRTLSLRNAKRQARDYMIYIITMIISVAILYTINATVTSENLDIFGGMSSTFMVLLYLLDAVVILIVGWLVNYMMRFMLEKEEQRIRHVLPDGHGDRTGVRDVSEREFLHWCNVSGSRRFCRRDPVSADTVTDHAYF